MWNRIAKKLEEIRQKKAEDEQRSLKERELARRKGAKVCMHAPTYLYFFVLV